MAGILKNCILCLNSNNNEIIEYVYECKKIKFIKIV